MTNNKHACGAQCEVYSRVCGYFRPVSNWNKGKKEEFKDRKTFEIKPEMKIRKIDSGYEPQTGIEFSTWEINGNATN